MAKSKYVHEEEGVPTESFPPRGGSCSVRATPAGRHHNAGRRTSARRAGDASGQKHPVQEACKTIKPFAIAHGHEEQYEGG